MISVADGDLPAADKADCSDNTHAIFHRGKGLCPDWETNFEALAKKDILPNMGKDKALRGVFFGERARTE